MNKIKWLVSAIAALSLSVAPISCSRDDEPDEPYYPDYPENPSGPGNNGGDQGGGSGDSKTMTLIPTSLTFPAAGATENVYVQNAPGTVEVSKPSWLTVTYVSQGKYQIKASANTGARRTGTVYFVSGNSNCSLAVEQEGKNDGGTGGDSGGSGTGGGSETGQKPTAPTGLTAYPDGPSSAPFANIKWNTVSGAKQYIVYRSTSASFSYPAWADKDGFVRAGIILENENGTGGGVPKVYDTKNKRWIN